MWPRPQPVLRNWSWRCRSARDLPVEPGAALAPARLIPGGMPTEATVAHVMVSKYADHLPLYRQAQIYSRQDVELDFDLVPVWWTRR